MPRRSCPSRRGLLGFHLLGLTLSPGVQRHAFDRVWRRSLASELFVAGFGTFAFSLPRPLLSWARRSVQHMTMTDSDLLNGTRAISLNNSCDSHRKEKVGGAEQPTRSHSNPRAATRWGELPGRTLAPHGRVRRKRPLTHDAPGRPLH